MENVRAGEASDCFSEYVADPCDVHDKSRVAPSLAESASDRGDVYLQGVAFDEDVGPDVRYDFGTRNCFARMLGQQEQDIEGAAADTDAFLSLQEQLPSG